MNCTVGGPNVKILGKAIHSLARIGDDLYIETLSSGMAFRTVNSSRSAYVCFTFEPEFFVQYKPGSHTTCKVSLKSCLMAFRYLQGIEKNVEKCLISMDSIEDTLLIHFYCKHDMMKIYHLPFIENETVQAAFQKCGFQCKLTAQSRLLMDGIHNFSGSVDEVTLTVCRNKVTLKNYVDDEPDPNKVVHTELTLESEEFELYEVEEETELTFCLKEFKAILNFSEGCNVPVSICCQSGGKPIVFNINSLPGVDADFVLATLAERDTQSSGTSLQRNPIARSTISAGQSERVIQPEDQNKSRSPSVHIINAVQQVPATLVTIASGTAATNRFDAADHSFNKSEFSYNSEGENNNLERVEEEDLDVIPATPPKKKFRSAFLGLSELSQYTSMAPDPDEILAEASDED